MERPGKPRCEIAWPYGPSGSGEVFVHDQTKLEVCIELDRRVTFELNAESAEPGRTSRYKPWSRVWGVDRKEAVSLLDAIETTASSLSRRYGLKLTTSFNSLRPGYTLRIAVVVDATIDREGLGETISAAERLASRVDRALRDLESSTAHAAASLGAMTLGAMTFSNGFYRGSIEALFGRTVTVLFQDHPASAELEPERRARVAGFIASATAKPEAIRTETARRLLATHTAWFEDEPIAADMLASGLTLQLVIVPPDFADLTLTFDHPALSGHFLEVNLKPTGDIAYVGLQGQSA